MGGGPLADAAIPQRARGTRGAHNRTCSGIVAGPSLATVCCALGIAVGCRIPRWRGQRSVGFASAAAELGVRTDSRTAETRAAGYCSSTRSSRSSRCRSTGRRAGKAHSGGTAAGAAIAGWPVAIGNAVVSRDTNRYAACTSRHGCGACCCGNARVRSPAHRDSSTKVSTDLRDRVGAAYAERAATDASSQRTTRAQTESCSSTVRRGPRGNSRADAAREVDGPF